MKRRGAPPKFSMKSKLAERKLVIQGIRDGMTMQAIANSLGYKRRQSIAGHHPGVRAEAMSKIRI